MSGINWQHEVSENWIKARRTVLTASEIRDLIPALKRYSKSGDVESFYGMWGDKHQTPLEEVTWAPSVDAARGHVMEPYAIHEYNQANIGPMLSHWDDFIVIDQERHAGFSPDALDISQPDRGCKTDVANVVTRLANTMAEIKCYTPKRHIQMLYLDKDKHKERYQIAATMALCSSINNGYLIFYCPQSDIPFHYKQYSRVELTPEIEQCNTIIDIWNDVCARLDEQKQEAIKTTYTERQIYDEYIEELTDPYTIS